jgi:[acyl-carrier-protein] S-malonyltransferase
MLAAGYATYRVLASEVELSPLCMAGHSLGEYTALVAAGSLDFAEGIKLVRKRAELMQSAVPVGTGAMAAILGLDDDKVVEICANARGGVVEAVNFNSPGQVVIAGDKDAVEATCSLMNGAAEEFSISVDAISFNQVANVLHNVDASVANSTDEIKSKLVAQLHKPVLWTSTVQAMSAAGVEKLIEAGPGKVLAGLTKRIDKSLSGSAIINVDTLRSVIEEIK